MPLSNDDYATIVQDLLHLLKQYRLDDLAEAALGRSVRRTDNRESAIEFLQALRDGLVSRSRTTYERALRLSQEFIRTESGHPIDDIEVIPTVRERELF